MTEQPTKIVMWLNVYPTTGFYESFFKYGVYPYASREAADEHAAGGRIACIRVEFEEGQLDE